MANGFPLLPFKVDFVCGGLVGLICRSLQQTVVTKSFLDIRARKSPALSALDLDRESPNYGPYCVNLLKIMMHLILGLLLAAMAAQAHCVFPPNPGIRGTRTNLELS